MSIVLRTVKGSALTYEQLDENLSQFYYSASLHNSGTRLRLYYTGSAGLSITPGYDEVVFPLTTNTLQSVTNTGNVTTNAITALSFIKSGSTSDDVLLGDGTTTSLSGIGGSTDTGSLLTTASVNLNEITFTKGDSSTFTLPVNNTLQQVTDNGNSTTTDVQFLSGSHLQLTDQATFSPVLGSQFEMNINDSTSTGNIYPSLKYIKRSNGTGTESSVADYNYMENNGTVDSGFTRAIWNHTRDTNTGVPKQLIGAENLVQFRNSNTNGTGSVELITANENTTALQDYGFNGTIQNALGIRAQVQVDAPDATINDVYVLLSELDISSGSTVDSWKGLSIDVTQTVGEGTISSGSFIQIETGIDESAAQTNGIKAINSLVDLPSYFRGDIEMGDGTYIATIENGGSQTGDITLSLPTTSGTLALSSSIPSDSSYISTASVNLNEITFTKGDSSTFIITVDTGSAGTSLFETGSSTPTIQTVYGTNTARASYSVVLGGNANDTTGQYSSIVGGLTNVITNGQKSGISAGELNTIYSNFSFIGAGLQNTGSGDYSVIGGGIQNQTLGSGSFIGGGGNFGGKYGGNTASGLVSTIAGGSFNIASGNESTIGGGFSNTASGQGSTIGGGLGNIASGSYSGVLSGESNIARGEYSGIIAGFTNSIQSGGIRSVILGGRDNEILASGSVILGGSNNDITVNGNFSSIIAGNQITVNREITAFANSVYVTGSASTPATSVEAVLQVARRETTPSTPEDGMIINSGSAGNSDLWFYKGSVGGWVKLTP